MRGSVIIRAVLCMLSLIWLTRAMADERAVTEDRDFWVIQTSVYTRHFKPAPEHNNQQDLLGLEHHAASGRLYGVATFRNSFGQRSVYGYVGRRIDSKRYPVYLKLTGGLIHGYRDEYRDKIPLNRYGIAPVIIPGVGVRIGPVTAEAVLLGASATMLSVGIRF